MRFTLVALAVGVALGLLGGGRLSNLGQRSFRLWPLLPVGAVLQVVNSPVALTLSYAALIAFAAANLRVPGFGLLVIGLALNAAVVVVNGAMPVRADIAAAGGKHRPERTGDHLLILDDRLDVPPLGEVLSFGDVVLAVGLSTAAAALVRRPPQGRHAQLADDSGIPRLR